MDVAADVVVAGGALVVVLAVEVVVGGAADVLLVPAELEPLEAGVVDCPDPVVDVPADEVDVLV